MSKIKAIEACIITCPICQYKKLEEMPIDASQYFYRCKNCKNVIRAKEGDCCVYCSFGDIKCLSMDEHED